MLLAQPPTPHWTICGRCNSMRFSRFRTIEQTFIVYFLLFSIWSKVFTFYMDCNKLRYIYRSFSYFPLFNFATKQNKKQERERERHAFVLKLSIIQIRSEVPILNNILCFSFYSLPVWSARDELDWAELNFHTNDSSKSGNVNRTKVVDGCQG